MERNEYGIYGTEGKKQLFCERVIFHDEPGIGYMKQGKILLSFIQKRDLLKALEDGPYRYVKDPEDEKVLG